MIKQLLCFMWGCQYSKSIVWLDHKIKQWKESRHRYRNCGHCGKLK